MRSIGALRAMENLTAILGEDVRGAVAERLRSRMVTALAGFETLVRGRAAAARSTPRTEWTGGAMEAVRETLREIRQAETDVRSARIEAGASAGRWVNWLAIVMTGLVTALTTALVAALVFLARPGAWR